MGGKALRWKIEMFLGTPVYWLCDTHRYEWKGSAFVLSQNAFKECCVNGLFYLSVVLEFEYISLKARIRLQLYRDESTNS